MLPTLLHNLHQAIQAGEPVAVTVLVETRGSTPLKPGAVMLVFADGSQCGTLGGGCVEAEVKRQALRLLDAGERQLLTFQLDDNSGGDDGLNGGGRMKMLVDPVRPGADLSYYETLRNRVTAGAACTEVVILDSAEPADAQPGDRFLLDPAGNVVAVRGSSPLPPRVSEELRPIQNRPRAYTGAGAAFLPILERCRLIVVGAGPVGWKAAQLAAEVDFDVWVVDDREEYCNSTRFPQAKRLIVGPIDTALSGLEIDSDTYCLVVTRDPGHDEEALYHLAETPARYVGMIGSKRKIKLIFEDLLQEGISRDALMRVHAPLGLDIGSQTIPEIAISLVAELIAHRNLGACPDRHRRPSLLELMQ